MRGLSVESIKTAVRFLAVGVGASLLYAAVTSLLINGFRAPPLPTSVLVYCGIIPLAFLAQRHLVFRSEGRSGREFLLYATMQLVSVGLLTAIIRSLLTGSFLIDTAILFVMAGLAAAISFLVCRFLIFEPRSAGGR